MPRKSNVSAVSGTGDETGKEKEREGINIEDLSMPRTMVQRLAKGVLAPNTQVQKDAITAMSKGATVFINYISHAANEHTQSANRKTINPNDVLLGLRDTGFDFMLPRLEAELAKYNEVQTAKRNEYRKKVREGTMGTSRRKSVVSAEGGAEGNGGERSAKKLKAEDGEGVSVMAGDGAGDERDEEMEVEMEEESAEIVDGGHTEGGEAEDGQEEEEDDDDEEEDEGSEGAEGEDTVEDLGSDINEGEEDSEAEEDSD